MLSKAIKNSIFVKKLRYETFFGFTNIRFSDN